MINIQPIEKQVASDGQFLDVHSIFYTIQGEGPHTGKPAVFIRLAGCNLQCPGCDTDYTSNREQLSVPQIMHRVELAYEQVKDYHLPLIVITGGEPFRQNLVPLVAKLVLYHSVQIETNGTLPVPDAPAFKYVDIVCSPKTGKVHKTVELRAKCFKYVLHHQSVNKTDGLPVFALDHSAAPEVARPNGELPIYLQPMDSKDEEINKLNMAAVLASCLKFGYTLQIQTHKTIGVE